MNARRTIVGAVAALTVLATAAAGTGAGQPSFAEAGQFGQTLLAKGIATAPDGTVFVADTNNNRIQMFSATGASQGSFGALGTGAGRFTGPEKVAVAPDGNVWVADYNNSRVQELRRDGSSVRVIGQGLLLPGVAVDAEGNVWATKIGGNGAGTVVKYDRASGFSPSTSWGGLSYPRDIEVSPDGSVYVAVEGQDRRIARFDTAGRPLGSIPVGVNNPLALEVDLDCNVWVGDIAQRRIVKYSPSGKLLGELRPKTETSAWDLAVGPTGNLYVVNGGRTVLRLTESRKPGAAAVPGRIVVKKTAKGYAATIPYALTGVACPVQVGASASLAGKGLSGRASGLSLAAGRRRRSRSRSKAARWRR
jgi:sugar lactone lactonase YvrE